MEGSFVARAWVAWAVNSAFSSLVTILLGVIFRLLGFSFLQCAAIAIPIGPALWLTFWASRGLTSNPPKTGLVIERFEQYYRIAREGITILLFPGWIDRIAPNGGKFDTRAHKIDLQLKSDSKELIDFLDDSAKVVAEIWYSIKNEETDPDAPYKWVYNVVDDESRIIDIITAAARPLMQSMTIDDAQVNMKDIERQVITSPGVTAALDAMGVCLDPHRGFVIKDIALRDETIKERQKVLAGKKDAERQAALGSGYANSILNIQRAAQAAGEMISFADARAIYEYQRGLEQLGQTGAHISFISPDLKNIMTMLGMNPGTK